MPPAFIRIGLSGWRYRHWRGTFYPPKLPQRKELAYVATLFPTAEINGTFYSLQRPASFQRWASETPDEFLFAIKGGRFITHMRKLLHVETALANFFASGTLALGPKLGPVLWQLPPQLRFTDPARFEAFFKLLPRSTRAAARLAQKCDERLLAPNRSHLKAAVDIPIRHAIEIRHDSFATPEFIALLRRQDIGLVVADTVEWPLLLDVTSSLVYLRLHGSEQLYVSGYEAPAIDTWARRILAFATGQPAPLADDHARYAAEPLADGQPREVFVFFDNDAHVRAPADAQALIARVAQLTSTPPSEE